MPSSSLPAQIRRARTADGRHACNWPARWTEARYNHRAPHPSSSPPAQAARWDRQRHCQPDVVQVRRTHRRLGMLPRRGQVWKQHGHQKRYDSDDDQQLDQGESTTSRFSCFHDFAPLGTGLQHFRPYVRRANCPQHHSRYYRQPVLISFSEGVNSVLTSKIGSDRLMAVRENAKCLRSRRL